MRAKLDTLIEIVNENIIEFVARHHGHQGYHHRQHGPQQPGLVGHHEIPEFVHHIDSVFGDFLHFHRQHAHQRRQKRHGIHKRRDYAHGHEIAQMLKRRDFGKIHGQKADGRGETGQKHRLQVHPQTLHDGVMLTAAVAHFEIKRHQHMDRIGDGDGEDNDGRGHRGGRQRKSQIAPQTHGGYDGKDNDQHRRHRTHQTTQQQHQAEQHHTEAERHQSRHVRLGILRKGVVHEHHAGEMHLHVGMRGPHVIGHGAHERDDFRNLLSLIDPRQLHRHIDRRHVTLFGHQSPHQQRFIQGDLANISQFPVTQRLRARHQIGDNQVIALRFGILEIGNRIDTDGIGNLPRLFGQLFHQRQRVATKHIAIGWRQHDQHIVVFGISRLHRLKRLELWVVLTEVHPVIGCKTQILRPTGRQKQRHQSDRNNHPPQFDHPPAER